MNTIICPNCGKEIDDDSSFCTYCGHPITHINTLGKIEPRLNSTNKKKNLFPFWLLIAIVVLLVLSNILLFFLWRGKKSTPVGETNLGETSTSTAGMEVNSVAEDTASTKVMDENDPERFYTVDKEKGLYHYPECEETQKIPVANKRTSITTRAELISEGYKACSRCIENAESMDNNAPYGDITDYQGIEMELVNSEKFIKAGYDEEKKQLIIQFRATGSIYMYYDVPYDIYESFVQADNLEDYWDKNIRTKFKSEKVV